MNENEEKLSKSEQKERIRQRYRGVDIEELEVIPAMPREELYDENKEKRVAVYARVSTDDPRQTSSYELQKNHYEDVVSRKPGWNLTKIYADEGISGTSLKHRDAFAEMIEDCKAGKIDLILTKSVSRFARNVLDCIGHIRMLAALDPPVGIFFEAENLYTLDKNSEMALSFISTLAQEESHTKSEIMNASIEMRFSRGIFLTPPLLGYDRDEEGNLVINEEEAKTVRLIFFMYLFGYSCQSIADTLVELGRKTKKGNVAWSSSTVAAVLRNERHCGDVLARKTYTPNYLDHKSKINRKNRNQYRQNNNHEAIISRTDFITVQHMLDIGRKGASDILPALKVIDNGVLKGFITVNPTWAGFKKRDYYEAYKKVEQEPVTPDDRKVEVQEGEFDLRGYQVAYGQFFNSSERIVMMLTNKKIGFNRFALDKLGDNQYVELLVEPFKRVLAIRPSNKDNKCAVKWYNFSTDGSRKSRQIAMSACLPTIFDIFDWNQDCRYRVSGSLNTNGTDSYLLFDISQAEMQIPEELMLDSDENATSTEYIDRARNTVTAYPASWADSFGNGFYAQSEGHLPEINMMEAWDLGNCGKTYAFEEDITQKTTEDIQRDLDEVLADIRKDEEDERREDFA